MDHRKGRILVVGGGPAGCAAAITLLRKGFEVTLFESGRTGRDKVCGDGFTADSHNAMKELGVFEEFREHALEIPGFLHYGYRNKKSHVDLGLFTLQRSRFDQMMRDQVTRLGGRVIHDSHVDTVKASRESVTVSCKGKAHKGDCLVLATGARTRLARQLGFRFPRHDAVAMRAYAPNDIGLESIVVWMNEKVSPAYGWVFPVPGNQLNIGIGHRRRYMPKKSLDRLMDEFLRTMKSKGIEIVLESRPRAWMIRAGLVSGNMSRERVVLVGENIHTTYYFTGEGIGKALQSGIIAGETISESGGDYSADSLKDYDARIVREFSELHMGYKRASRFLNKDMFNIAFTYMISHSRKSRRILKEIMEEKRNPKDLFSLRGLIKTLFS